MLRAVPRRSRVQLAVRLAPFLFAAEKHADADILDFESLDEYAVAHATIAQLLGAESKPVRSSEVAGLRQLGARIDEYPGSVGTSDALFLSAVVNALAPRRMIEVGTASGFSAAIAIKALKSQRSDIAGVRLHTFDLHPRYYMDPQRPVGYAIEELVPELAACVQVHGGCDARAAAQLPERDEIDLAFIDANHQHPCPLLDLLWVGSVLRPKAWVLLHDVRLGTLGREARERGEVISADTPFGAEWLFNQWPYRKLRGHNIGAIQLPHSRASLIAFALRMMQLPFETDPLSHAGLRAQLYQSVAAL